MFIVHFSIYLFFLFSSRNSLRGITHSPIHPVNILSAYGATSSFDGIFIFLDILSGRSLEHGVLAQRRTQYSPRQALGHYSTFEEGMESLIRLQSERVLRSGPSPASYHRRKGGRKRSQVRRSDSCHLDPLDQRIPDFSGCGRVDQLFQVL